MPDPTGGNDVTSAVNGRVLIAIPARGGSKRLRRKNLALLNGHSLLSYTIRAATEADVGSDIFVCTEDDEIAAEASDHGAKVFRVPSEMAGDAVSSTVPCLALLDHLRCSSGTEFDYLCNLQPSSPLRSSADIRQACEQLAASPADFLVSVTLIDPHYFHWAVEEHADGWKLFFGNRFLRERTELPPMYRPNGAIKLARTQPLLRTGHYFGTPLVGFLMPEERSIHVATAFDLHCAAGLLTAR